MFQVTKEFRFEAAHKLPYHDGKCRRLHGHSFVMRVKLQDFAVFLDGPKQGMVIDFGDIKAAVQPLVDEYLDHHYLNETTGLENPTSEELARWIFQKLKPSLGSKGLHSVEVLETCTSFCCYFE